MAKGKASPVASGSAPRSPASSPAAKRAAIAPKTQRTGRAAAQHAAAAGQSRAHAGALAVLADALPDALLLSNAALNADEPTLGDRVSSARSTASSLLNGSARAARDASKRPAGRNLANGTRGGGNNNNNTNDDEDEDDEDDDDDELLPNGGAAGAAANGKKSANGRSSHSVGGAATGDDAIAPFPLPASVAGNPLASSPALSHALSQALHSADRALLSSILAHSDPLLIRATVQRLSGDRALALLEQCVARLVGSTQGGGGGTSVNGAGSSSANGAKGGAGSAKAGNSSGAGNDALARGTSTGKVRTTIEWVRAILLIHTAFLMALPHLTSRLAALHMALSARLASHNRLVALQGRLDLVLSQIEMRSAYAAAVGKSGAGPAGPSSAVAVQGVSSKLAAANAAASAKASRKGKAALSGPDDPTRWVEPSDDEDDDDEDQDEDGGMDVDGTGKDEDGDDDDGDDDDDDDDDEDEDEEDELELSPVLPAEELEDDSDIEDIMLGASPARTRRHRRVVGSEDDNDEGEDEDAGDTTADSGDEYMGTAAALRARALAHRAQQASKSDYAPAPTSVAGVSKRGKRGAAAAQEAAAAAAGKASQSGDKAAAARKKGVAEEMDLDEDEDDEADENGDDESLLDEEGDSELEDDDDEDEEDDEDHADYGMVDMEAESTDGDGEEDDDEAEEDDD